MCKQDCGCGKNNCFPENICRECEFRTTTDCITVDPELPNIGTDSGEVLSTVLELIDERLGITPPVPTISITNVGEGAESFKGLSNLGNYEFRSIQGSDNVTVTQTADNITIEVPDQRTYTASNAGNLGIGVYKDSTVGSTNTQFNFKNIVSQNLGSAGTELLLPISQSNDNITISAKKINSDSLIITEADNVISIETPVIIDIPRFIVNSASQAPTEDGSLSKPYKTIQGALDAFVGVGTEVSPEFAGAEIVIQKGIGYNFTGNFNYNALTVILEESTVVASNPSVGDFIVNFDLLPDVPIELRIVLKENSVLSLNKSGFKNSGTTVTSTNFQNRKSILIGGSGLLNQSVNSLSNTYTVFESNYTQTNTFFNDASAQFEINGISVQTSSQSIYKIGGNTRFIANNMSVSLQGVAALPVGTKFFDQIGGQVRWTAGNLSVIDNGSVVITSLFPLAKSALILCEIYLDSITITGKMVSLFENTTNQQSMAEVKLVSTKFFQCTNITRSPLVMWTGCSLYNNIFTSGIPDFTQTDLTRGNSISTYNIFNGNVFENLRTFASRPDAVSSGLKKGEKFINTSGVASPTTGWIIDMIME